MMNYKFLGTLLLIFFLPFPSWATDSEYLYNEAIRCGKNSGAFKDETLVDHKKLDTHTLYLLIRAYEKKHKKSKEILNQVTFLKAKKKKKIIGLFSQKPTLEGYNTLSKEEKKELSHTLSSRLKEIFPDIKRKKEVTKAFKTYFDEEEKLHDEFTKIQDQLGDIRARSVGETSEEDLEARVQLLTHLKDIAIKQIAATENLREQVYGPHSRTKVDFFKNTVGDKLILNFIAKITIAEGAAHLNPDWVNRAFQLERAAVGIGLAFVPYGGSAGATGANLASNVIETGYNAYRKWKIVRYVDRYCGNESDARRVLNLCELIVPATIEHLAHRYRNPINLYEAKARDIEKLAKYTAKRMIDYSWSDSKTWSKTSKELKLDDQIIIDPFLQEIAKFLCDGVSYSGLKLNPISKKRMFHHILSKSGVVRDAESEPVFYIRKCKKFVVAKDTLIRKDGEKSLEDHEQKAIRYGFRQEDKILEELVELGLSRVEMPESRKRAKELFELSNGNQEFKMIPTQNYKQIQEKKIVKGFFKGVIDVTVDNLPSVVGSIHQ